MLDAAGLSYRLVDRDVNSDQTLKMISHDEADISLLGFRMSVSRMETVAFTLPMDHLAIGFVTKEIRSWSFSLKV